MHLYVPLNNKYYRWYLSICGKAQQRGWTKKSTENYVEYHHIIPNSVGGSRKKENMVYLTGKEHYICHWLLCFCYEGIAKNKMIYAFNGMNNQRNNHQIKRYSSSSGYEFAKKQFKKTIQQIKGKDHHAFGKKQTEETQNKKRAKLKGIPLAQSTKDKMKLNAKKRCESIIELERLRSMAASYGMLGKHLSQEAKEKIRQKNSMEYICPYCNKKGKGPIMFKWHFENCLAKKVNL